MQTSGSHHLQADELPTVSTGGSYYNQDGRVGEHLTADWRTAGPGRILVIENDKALQKIIRRILVSEGYEVELVSNGTTGLELVRQKTPSALIVDLQFPGSPGCDLCRELMQAAPAVPFVVLSASSYIFGDVMVDFMKVEVVRGRVQIPLAMKEFRTLEFMIKNAQRVISRDE